MTFPDCSCARHRLADRVVLVVISLSVLLVSVACQPLITVQPASPAAVHLPTVVPEGRGISIIGVDFDPPLDYAQIAHSGGVTLLVAIKNEGLSTESDVRLTARLLDAAGSIAPAELLNETITVKLLAPGEVEIVRFTTVTELAVSPQYKLVVQLDPVAGEIDLEDNLRSYDIVVRGFE